MAALSNPASPSHGHNSAAGLNLPARMERLPLTRYQNRIFVIIATAWLFDSMDLAALTFLLAPISEEFALSGTQAGALASLSFAGMIFGASLAGVLADRFGRRPVFTMSMLVWGIASLVAAVSWDLTSLLVCRFFIGVGMGAEFPVAQALLSEFIPAKNRGKYLGWLEGFWPIGFIACGALSLVLVPWLGWRAVFAVQGLLSFYALYIRRAVPESPRWHAAVGQYDQAEQTVRTFESNVERALGKPLPEPEQSTQQISVATSRIPLSELFQRAYRSRTIMAWSLWFCVLLGYYGITTWMGKLLADAGMSIADSIGFVLLMTLWGIPGFLCASYLLERIGRKPIVTGFIVVSAGAAYLHGNADTVTALIVTGSIMQFFFFGMWSALYAYTPEVFSTRARATGCGTASAFGRAGALIGPLLIPILMDHSGKTAAFAVTGAFLILGAVIMLALGPETKDKVLEDVSS